jgi:hypothetical protein
VTSITDTPVGASTTEATVLYATPSQLPDALRVQSALSGLAIVGYDPGLVSTGTGGAGGGASTGRGGSTGSTTTSTIDVGSTLSRSEGADVVVVTGSNFAVNPPAGVPSSNTGPGPSSTTSSVPSGSGTGTTTSTTLPGPMAGNANLSAPSGSTDALQAWDPRSCTASGGAGP